MKRIIIENKFMNTFAHLLAEEYRICCLPCEGGEGYQPLDNSAIMQKIQQYNPIVSLAPSSERQQLGKLGEFLPFP